MHRPWRIWLVFVLCSVVLLGVMSWVSLTTSHLDRIQREAAQQAELEERARLALWRMDSWLASLIIEESARPASAYEAFHETPRAYSKSLTQLKQGEVLVPSSLLNYSSSNILLFFQFHPDGQVTSPQVPTGNQRELAETAYVSPEQIEGVEKNLMAFRQILEQPVAETEVTASSAAFSRSNSLRQQVVQGYNNGAFLASQAELPFNQAPFSGAILSQPIAQPPDAQLAVDASAQVAQLPPPGAVEQTLRNEIEYSNRQNNFQMAQQRLSVNNLKQQQTTPSTFASALEPAANVGVFKGLWLGEALVLARHVSGGEGFVVQGCWLNWTNLQSTLLASIQDLFPAAKLEPMRSPQGERAARMLAALPVKLVTGHPLYSTSRRWSPLRVSLVIAWLCVLLAGLAVALLLHGTLSLSERRASFVSAVTHELRTPLTTFKMYSEMLAEDMVTDEAKRKNYLKTLCAEANRLSHLVENVLAYARLERGSARQREERISLGNLIERVKPRLLQRVEQLGLHWVEDVAESARQTMVQVDVAAVEQILFNLVDNACKYAAPHATEKTIHLEALPENGKFAMLRVRDHGQGISAEAARRLFQPFSKSAQQAAQSAPGVGLGLALCRRLSRGMGGDLHWDPWIKDGAGFVLSLPVSASA